MPLRSMTTIRRWLAPWLVAAVLLVTGVVVRGGPPRELWLPMLAAMVTILLVAGGLSALLVSAVLAVLRVPLGSRGGLTIATLTGAVVAFLPLAPFVGSPLASLPLFALLALLSARRVAPADAPQSAASRLSHPARAT